MLKREQWESLAQFAGVEVKEVGSMADGSPAFWLTGHARHWQPLTDWRDFGPLWVKLEMCDRSRALDAITGDHAARDKAIIGFLQAKDSGDEKMIMQAGCALGAAIGATMGDKA